MTGQFLKDGFRLTCACGSPEHANRQRRGGQTRRGEETRARSRGSWMMRILYRRQEEERVKYRERDWEKQFQKDEVSSIETKNTSFLLFACLQHLLMAQKSSHLTQKRKKEKRNYQEKIRSIEDESQTTMKLLEFCFLFGGETVANLFRKTVKSSRTSFRRFSKNWRFVW